MKKMKKKTANREKKSGKNFAEVHEIQSSAQLFGQISISL